MAEQFEQDGAAQESTGTITISCGSNSVSHAAGKSVADLRSKLGTVLNIGSDTRAMVNGSLVADEATFVVSDGMTVEFIKEAGQKGC